MPLIYSKILCNLLYNLFTLHLIQLKIKLACYVIIKKRLNRKSNKCHSTQCFNTNNNYFHSTDFKLSPTKSQFNMNRFMLLFCMLQASSMYYIYSIPLCTKYLYIKVKKNFGKSNHRTGNRCSLNSSDCNCRLDTRK